MSHLATVGLAVNHVGVTVPDVFAAIDWYADVFGFRCIMGPRVLESVGHGETSAVFGTRFRKAWQAHLLAGNSVGIELFQFIDPPTQGKRALEDRVPYLQRGQWHLCVTHPDVDGMVHRVVEADGTLISAPQHFVPGRPWVLAYVTDPWGTVLEIMSHTYAEAFGNWPQPGQVTPPTIVPRDCKDL
jgi:predicted enzyme related to lactoylglutathione lyase